MNWLAASFDAHKTELIFWFYPKFPLRNSRNRRNGVSSNRSWAVRRPPSPSSHSFAGVLPQLMISLLKFPTEPHREVAELAGDFFSAHAQVDTILVAEPPEGVKVLGPS